MKSSDRHNIGKRDREENQRGRRERKLAIRAVTTAEQRAAQREARITRTQDRKSHG